MTGHKWRWIAGMILIIAGVSSFVFWLLAPDHAINEATARQIDIGMPESEVLRLVGGPAGDYSKGPLRHDALAKLSRTRELVALQFESEGRKPWDAASSSKNG